jgi:hypothetical protein
VPAEVANEGTGFGLANRIHDLPFGEFRPLHRSSPFVGDHQSRHRTRVSTCLLLRGNAARTYRQNPVKCDAMLHYPLVFRLKLDLMRPTPPFSYAENVFG